MVRATTAASTAENMAPETANRRSIVLLTFDYELFMREPGTVERCMLRPTERILEVLGNRGVRATFFVDTCYLLRVRRAGSAARDADAIEAQLRAMVSRGHRIELHLHTSWLDAEFVGGRLLPRSFGRYRFHQLDPADREAVFGDNAALAVWVMTVGSWSDWG
jgi:Polysaccharide deacetylase